MIRGGGRGLRSERGRPGPAGAAGGELAEVPGALPPAALAHYTGYLLRRAFVRFASDTREPGADPRGIAVLEALAERDWLSQLDLADELGINRTVMVWVLDRI